MEERTYMAIDLKSFYASVECRERNLDPMDTHLVVADESRTDKTICLAVSPSLRAFGISGRGRLFEVRQRVREINGRRLAKAPGGRFSGSSCSAARLEAVPSLSLDFLIARPRMAHYIKYSTWIYEIYQKYFSPEDMVVYSIDEVFVDMTDYLKLYQLCPKQLARKVILDVLDTTGITAAAGIGTNLFLCKAAMDIVAKHIPADENGVRIAYLDEMQYRRLLWDHRPITDFWRVGRGYARRLEENGLFTMGDVARCSVWNEALLYRLFGKNAELLIDHAWGWEPCTVPAVKSYRPDSSSLGSGQVLPCAYDVEKARLVLLEMADALALDLVDRGLMTDQLVLTVGYDIENLTDPRRAEKYQGEVTTDGYGRRIPRHGHGTETLEKHTSSAREILKATAELYDRVTDSTLLIRRLNLTANHILTEAEAAERSAPYRQLDLFTDYEALAEKEEQERQELAREKKMQQAVLSIKKKFGKNAILKGSSLEEGATARTRNAQIGGHHA